MMAVVVVSLSDDEESSLRGVINKGASSLEERSMVSEMACVRDF